MPTQDFSIQGTLQNPNNFFVIAIREASNLGSIFQRYNPQPPYGVSFQLQVTGLTAKKGYVFELWESPNTTVSGILWNSYSFVPTAAPIALTKGAMTLVADTSLGLSSGTIGYVDPNNSLVGWTYTVQLNGTGTLVWGQDIQLTANNNWEYIGGSNAKQISSAEVYTIFFDAQIQAAPNPPTSLITNARVLDQSLALTSADVNTDLLIMAQGMNIIITLPDISTVSDFDPLYFDSNGGSHQNASIRCFGSDKIQRKTQVTKVVLGQQEYLTLYKYTPVTGSPYWRVRAISPTVDMVGQFVYSYDKSALLDVNTVFADGRYLNRQVFERLYDKALADGVIAGDLVKTLGQYGSGSDLTNFSIPNLNYYGFQMGVLTGAGATIQQNFPQHDHVMHGKGLIANQYYLSNDNSRYGGGGGDRLGGALAPDTDLRTGDAGSGIKMMIDNTACYISIRC